MSLESITISDSASGASAKILPGVGFNCYSFSVPTDEGPVETLWAAPDFAAGQGKPSHSGIPLMFPFAGRIRGTSFLHEGKRYELEAGDGQGNAIHGFVIGSPWRVTSQTADRVVGTFQASIDDKSLLERWPADFRITADYRVAGKSLVTEYVIENPDQNPLPFAFGTHPYFRVPLGKGLAADCRVTVPVAHSWELAKLLPTGKKTPAGVAAELEHGMRFETMKLDNVFGGLAFKDHRCEAKVHDPASRRTLVLSFDDQFTTCVVYNPPHREAVCIEPYTTVPDPFVLAEMGIDPHLQVLASGRAFRTRIETRLE